VSDVAPRISVGITTRNRPASLERCLASLRHIAHLSPEVFVFDDRSDVPVARSLSPDSGIRVLRGTGYIAGRNAIVAAASSDSVLLLDDDAALIGAPAIEQALEVLRQDPAVAAIAFAQADADGKPWPEPMQPGLGAAPRYVPSFIGFAHLVRRDVFLRLGGYRERFVFYGEEKDYCLRLIDEGYHIVYIPQALVTHAQDKTGRNSQRYLRHVTRNDCLFALLNEPLTRVWWSFPGRFARYFSMRRAWKVRDGWGWLWLLWELGAHVPWVLRERRPVSLRSIRAWQRLRRPGCLYTNDQ
jgi:GT2 family glycosyltransferase